MSSPSLGQSEREFLAEHSLKKPMRTLHVWALGVGVVITGEYFGWNPGLKEAGPIGMLLASLFVCALYIAWAMSLSELSVAMPYAGGPLAYGRRASGPLLGFIMGWSMFLESLFAMIGTAIAAGGAVFFLVDLLSPQLSSSIANRLGLLDVHATPEMVATTSRLVMTTGFGLLTVVIFAIVQLVGAKEQAKVMEWITYAAIGGLIWFWIVCIPGIDVQRIITKPILIHGWTGVAKAIPYAIWWLVIIETVALAAEEAHDPHITIPRGILLAQLTLVGLVVMTWFVASASGTDFRKTGDSQNLFPLQFVYSEVWPGSWHLTAFCIIALFGMVASYNGMLFAVSRQSFALGRAGYLPRVLGHVHPIRRVPDISILVWSLVAAAFVVWGYFNESAVFVAVLTCNLTALIWYVLAMICLFVLRRKEPDMPRPYKVPFYPYLPASVIVMSLIAAIVYGYLQETIVLWLTLAMYAVGILYFLGYSSVRLERAAPEELTARGAVIEEALGN